MALTKVTGDFIKDGVLTQAHLHSNHGITSTHIGEGDKLFFTNARVDSRIGSLSTSNLSEGSNLYYTNARARAAISVSGNALSYNSSTGVITSNFEESPTFSGNVIINGSGSSGNALSVTRGSDGTTALRVQNSGEVVTQANYFYATGPGVSMYVQNTAVFRGAIMNDASGAAVRIGDALTIDDDLTVSGGDITLGGTGRIQGIDTVSAGTDAANKTYVDNQVAGIVDSAPSTLDTLNELAAALGDDANFSTTVTNNIATKMPLAGGTFTGFIQLGANQLRFDQSGTRSWTVSAFSGNLNINSGDSLGNVAISSGLTIEDTAIFNGDMTLPAAADNFDIGFNLSTTGKIRFGHTSWNNSLGLESYWMVLRTNQNEGLKLIDSAGNTYVQFNASNNSSGAYDSTFKGDIITSGVAGDGTPLLTLTGSASATFNWISKSLHANLTAGETNLHLFGKAASTKNSGYIGYNWAADASNNNYVSIGHYSANHLFRVYGDQVLSTITLRSDVDMRAPIFYDKNNTSYYAHLDDTGTSIRAAGTVHASLSNMSAYQLNGTYVMDSSRNLVNIAAITATGTVTTGPIIANVSGTGVLNIESAGTNAVYIRAGSGDELYIGNDNTYRLRFTGSNILMDNGGYLQSNASLRAPIFYDSNDTGKYVDPNGTSVMHKINASHATTTGSTAPGYTGGAIEVVTSGNYVPAIGFHRGGYSATTLYEYDGELYVNPWTTRAQSGKLLSSGNWDDYVFSGSWNGSNFPGSRWNGFSVNGGEIVFQRDNPSSGKMSVMVDGNFYAGENGGFWSIYSGNDYNNKVGIYGDSSGNLNIGTSTSENVLRTNFGYIQMGPMNSSHAHIYTDRANFYLNKPLYVLGSTLLNQNDIRTQILYDANDTSYYFEGNGTSRFHSIWCRGAAVNSAPRWDTSFHVAQSQHFYGHSSTQTIYHGEAGNTYQFPGNGGVRSQIFYDYNNTGYYLHGDNISNLHSIDFDGVLSGAGRAQIGRNHAYDTLELKGYGAEMMIGGQSGSLHINYRTCNNGASGQTPTIWYWRAGASNNWSTHNFGDITSNGIATATGSHRAPLFYDTNNTAYYADFASTGVFNNFQLKGTINLPASGLATHGSTHRPGYGIYQEGGSWSHPYPDLCIAMHTGIKLGANASYNGIRFYSDYQMSDGATMLMSINDSSSPAGASNVYIANYALAGGSFRGPIYYDSNNTNFYTRPSTSSLINALYTEGTIQAGTSGTGNIFLGNNGGNGTGNHFRFHTNNSHTYFDGNCGDIHWRQGSSTRFYFYMTSANMTINGTLTQNSDERIKENIVEIPNALEKIDAMRGVYYNRTDINTEVKKIGVIAQEVEAVLPEVILEAPDTELKSVAYAELTAVLINGIKEQQVIIDDLKARIEILENQ